MTRSQYKEKTWALPYSLYDLQQNQLNDPDIGPVLQWKEKDERPSEKGIA